VGPRGSCGQPLRGSLLREKEPISSATRNWAQGPRGGLSLLGHLSIRSLAASINGRMAAMCSGIRAWCATVQTARLENAQGSIAGGGSAPDSCHASYPFLKDTHFGPDEIAPSWSRLIRPPYESWTSLLILPELRLVAKTIVMLATQGERDPVRLRERAIEIISGLPSDVA
jgi:hypothetical protein